MNFIILIFKYYILSLNKILLYLKLFKNIFYLQIKFKKYHILSLNKFYYILKYFKLLI